MNAAVARRALVQRLEQEAVASPGLYRLKLALLALLGYAVLLGALALTLGMVLFLVWHMAFVRAPSDPQIVIPIILLGMVGLVLLRAMWIRFEAPAGHHLQPGQAPALRAEVERIRVALGARALHGIVVTAELNAAAAYVPAGLGLVQQRHYLIIGLPLLQVLDRREFAAVVAHEFGHFHAGHGRFTGWIYRLRSTWYRVLHGMSGEGMWGSQVFWLFFRWYSPYFDAYSQVLARSQEYAADAVAAQVAGADAAASALLRIEQASDWLQGEFWPDVDRSAREQSYPPVRIHERLGQALQGLSRTASAPPWVLRRQSDPDDTHPSLQQRLAALQGAPSAAPFAAATHSGCARELLGEALVEALEQRFSLEWRANVEADWLASHKQWQCGHSRLAHLEAHRSHTPQELLEMACLQQEHRAGTDSLPLHLAALEQMPSSANAHYRLGALLLERGDAAAALPKLERAVALDPLLLTPVLAALERSCRRHALAPPGFADADALHARLSAAASDQPIALEASDGGLQPHGLDPTQLAALGRAFTGYEKVAAAWVVREPLQGAELTPHYLVVLDWAGSVASERAALEPLQARLQLPGTCTLLPSSSDAAHMRRIKQCALEPAWRRQR